MCVYRCFLLFISISTRNSFAKVWKQAHEPTYLREQWSSRNVYPCFYALFRHPFFPSTLRSFIRVAMRSGVITFSCTMTRSCRECREDRNRRRFTSVPLHRHTRCFVRGVLSLMETKKKSHHDAHQRVFVCVCMCEQLHDDTVFLHCFYGSISPMKSFAHRVAGRWNGPRGASFFFPFFAPHVPLHHFIWWRMNWTATK